MITGRNNLLCEFRLVFNKLSDLGREKGKSVAASITM